MFFAIYESHNSPVSYSLYFHGRKWAAGMVTKQASSSFCTSSLCSGQTNSCFWAAEPWWLFVFWLTGQPASGHVVLVGKAPPDQAWKWETIFFLIFTVLISCLSTANNFVLHLFFFLDYCPIWFFFYYSNKIKTVMSYLSILLSVFLLKCIFFLAFTLFCTSCF